MTLVFPVGWILDPIALMDSRLGDFAYAVLSTISEVSFPISLGYYFLKFTPVKTFIFVSLYVYSRNLFFFIQ